MLRVTTRYQAFGLHLLISMLVFLALLAIIIFSWFPNGLIFAGGLQGLKIVLGVDLVLGPLLTLVVFKLGKPGLKIDLTLIACLQVACLAFGIHVINKERPVAQLLMHDGIHFISNAEAKSRQLDFKQKGSHGVKKIMIELPEDASSWDTVVFATEFADAEPFIFRSDLYIDFDNVTPSQFQHRVLAISERHIADKSSSVVRSEMSELPAHKHCSWIPVISTHAKGYACISKKQGVEQLSQRKIW